MRRSPCVSCSSWPRSPSSSSEARAMAPPWALLRLYPASPMGHSWARTEARRSRTRKDPLVPSPLLKPVPTGRPSMFDVPRCSDLDILDADLAVVGVPFSVPYDLHRSTLCSTAPQAIREQSIRFAPRYLSHYDFDFGGDLLAGRRVEMVDCGDVATTPSTIQENPGRVTAVIRKI